MYRLIFNSIKNRIPKISPTELIALESGNVSIDRDILNGKIEYPDKKKTINKFPKDELERLLDNFKDKPLFPDNKNFKSVSPISSILNFFLIKFDNCGLFFIVKNKLSLLEMSTKTANLEDIFRKLT